MAYITPTSWTDQDMDWTAPDASNPVYLDAIWAAVTERTIMAGVGSYSAGPDTLKYSRWQSPSARPYNTTWARDLATRILGLADAYVIINTDTETRVETPYLTIASQIVKDNKLADLCVSPGDLLSSSRSGAFLKACKHFLDMMTITTEHSNEQYGYSGSTPHLFTHDLWTADSGDEALEDYDRHDAGSWGTHFSTCVAGKTITNDVNGTFLRARFTGNTINNPDFLSAPVNVVYHSRTALAHNLLIQMYSETRDADESTWQYTRPWDWLGLGLGLAHGDMYTLLAPAGGGDVPIEADAIVAPSNTPSYMPPGVDPPPGEPYPPYYNNVFFRGKFTNFAFDYGVTGGFKFYTTGD